MGDVARKQLRLKQYNFGENKIVLPLSVFLSPSFLYFLITSIFVTLSFSEDFYHIMQEKIWNQKVVKLKYLKLVL